MRRTQTTRKSGTVFFWTALVLTLTGPAGISAAQGTAATVKTATQATQPSQTVKTATQATQPLPEEIYRYNPEGRIDPFKPFVDLDAAAKKKIIKSKARPLSPLQQLGVEQFRLVGIIGGNKSRRAMVQDTAGKFYSLIPGSYIGLNNGRVTAIHKDSVIIQERITTDDGKTESRRQVMKLRQDEVKP